MSYFKMTRSRRTGAVVMVGTAEDLSLCDDGGRWVTICCTHWTVCNHTTLADARAHAPAVQWCEDCEEDVETDARTEAVV